MLQNNVFAIWVKSHKFSHYNLYKAYSGVSFLYNADVMTSALFETSKNLNCLFLLPASILAKYFNLRIHQCSISIVFSLFLGTAYMLLCNNGIATAGLQLVGYPNISAELN